MTRLLNARLGFGPALLNAGANVYHAPDTGIGGAMSENPSTGESLSMEMVWRHGALTRSSHDGWGPTGIVAYGRAPGAGDMHDASGLRAKPAPKRMSLREYRTLLYAGINSAEDFELAKQLIMKASPTGRAIFEAFDRFLEAEEAKDLHEYKFQVLFPGEGTFASRQGDQNRVTSWGSAISIEAGESVFALLHEIVHSMPLELLPAELLRIPYRSPEQEELSFEDRFVRHIESAYHDEAISGLAEVILFDELSQAGAPFPKEGENGYVDHVRAMREVYMNEGVEAYLDSELYIGRNHRIDYNLNRLMQMAIMTLAEPETLKDVTVSSVLAEGGISIAAPDGSKAAGLLAAVNEVQTNPTPESIQAIAMHVPRMLQYVTLDPEVMALRVKEFFDAYSKGKNPRRGRGFLGKRDVTVGALRLLGKARAVYNDYVQQSMRRAGSSSASDRTEKPTEERSEQEMAAAGLTELEKRALRMAGWVEGVEDVQDIVLTKEEDAAAESGLSKIERYQKRKHEEAEAKVAAEAETVQENAVATEEEMTAAGLTGFEKEVLRKLVFGSPSADELDAIESAELDAIESADEKIERYRIRQREPEWTAAGLTEREKEMQREYIHERETEGTIGSFSDEDRVAYDSGEKKLTAYREQKIREKAERAEATNKFVVLAKELLREDLKISTLTDAERRIWMEVETSENQDPAELSMADREIWESAAKKIKRYREAREKRMEAKAAAAKAKEEVESFEERLYEAAKLTEEEIALYKEFEHGGFLKGQLIDRYEDGDDRAGRMLNVVNRVNDARPSMEAAEEKEAEVKKSFEEAKKSFMERAYEKAELTEEEIALHKEYKREGLTIDDLGAMYIGGDERAARMRGVVERMEEIRWTIEMEIEEERCEAEYGAALDALGINRDNKESREFFSYMISAHDRAKVQQKSRDGDPEAKALLELVARVEAAKKRLDGETAASGYEFRGDVGDNADALDALWNMTLDLAQEADGKRRDDLVARASFLRRKVEGMPDSGKLSGIPAYLDPNSPFVDANKTIDGLRLAWDRIRDLHAAVLLRDKTEAVATLENIGSRITGAFEGWVNEGISEERVRAVQAVGIGVPGIMAAVGRIMRTARKIGLPVKKAYAKQLGTVAHAMNEFLRSEDLKHDELKSVGEGILHSRAFGQRAQADYVSFFFDLLDTPGTKKLAKEWARFFLGSPMGVFFYRRLNKSFDQAAKFWRIDYNKEKVLRAFEGHGFHHFFFPGTQMARDADVRSEHVGFDLTKHAGYGSFGDLLAHSEKVQKGKVKNTSIGYRHRMGWQEERNTLTIPVSSLPVEPSRLEGAIAYRGEGGVPSVDIALNGFYASLFRAWGLLMALPHFDVTAKEEMLDEVGKILEMPPVIGGELTLHTSLRLYFAHMLAVHGDLGGADYEASRIEWSKAEDLHPLPGGHEDISDFERELVRGHVHGRALASDMGSLVKAKIALAAHDKGDHTEALRRVNYLHDYYRSIVHLRREGVYPDGMARAAKALSRYPEYRDAAKSLLGLSIEHIDVFKNDEEIFPRAFEWLVRSIDGAALPYDARENLMSDLVSMVIPEVRATSGYSPQEIQLKSYRVARANDVIYERGLSAYLGRYERAEALLYNRTADLIEEYGSMATSNAELRGSFLHAAMRVNREVTSAKPELVSDRNVETFERMYDDAAFQLDLADVFPDQLAAFDPEAPVAEWNPTYVRRGLPEPGESFEKIKEALNALSETRLVIARSAATKQSRSDSLKNRDRHVGLQPPRDDNLTKEGQYQQTLDVYAAFVRWEVDRAVASQPHNRQAIENIVEAYRKRIEERGQIGDVSDVTGLTKDDAHLIPKYAMGIGRMLSRRELMNLRQTLGLPSVAFAFDRLGSAFDERRELNESDEKIIMSALDARGPHEALGKRELFLYTLIHDSATLKLKRRAAYNLALSFRQEETIARMIDAYEKNGDRQAEAHFYQRITGFWQLTGQLPSDYYLMLLDGAGNGTGDPLERLGELMSSNGAQPTVLDLELRYGWQRYYGRFIDDCQACIDSGFKISASIVHRDQVEQFIIPLKNDPERARSLVRELRVRHQNRLEEIEIAKANLPNIFLKQPPVVRFLLLSYFGELKNSERTRLVQEMNELERAEGRAQTFMHFFQMAGLEKLGQTLSTMVGIVPDSDRAVFARLQDKVPAGSVVEVRETIEREQGARIEELYDEFDETPIASASIAEVYRARMKDTGEEVYIKVIPNSKRRKIMDTAARLRRVAANYLKHSDRFAMGLDVAGMINWFADQLEGQLDLRKERNHATHFGGRHDAMTPSYFAATDSVLVMRPLGGFKVTDLDASSPHRATAARSVARTGVQAVLAGYYHADPHPGNIFVDETSGDVSWLDFGTMGHLDPSQRKQLMDFFFTLAIDDVHAQRMAIEAMGTPDASYDGDALEAAIAGLNDVEITERAARIIALAGEHRLFVQYQCSQAITNLLTLNGVVQELDPQFSLVSVMRELMPTAYVRAQHEIDGAGSSDQGKNAAQKPGREATSLDSLMPRERARSASHARATALYGLIVKHMDALEDGMGEDDFANFDELADGMVGLAERAPESPALKRGLNEVEDVLRKHLGDDVVDAVLED